MIFYQKIKTGITAAGAGLGKARFSDQYHVQYQSILQGNNVLETGINKELLYNNRMQA